MKVGSVINSMIEYYAGDQRRINHFLKVYGFAKTIGEMENLEEKQQEILEVAAVVHDIGIKISEEKYHSSAGNYQQIEGPLIARELLGNLEYPKELVERVCYLIAHHHTYNNIEDKDYQILVEADFLVNIGEENMKAAEISSIRDKIFRTRTGLKLIEEIY